MNTRDTARFVGLTMAALAVSGCGGGSSKPSAQLQAPTQFSSVDDAVTDRGQREGIRAAAATAAGNTPNAGGGSVTQSSTAADSVAATVERAADGTISWTVAEAGGWSVNRENARVRATPRGEGWRGIQFHQAPGGGEGSGTGPGLYVDVYTDIEAPTTRPAAAARPALAPAAAGGLAPAALAPADHPGGCGVGGTVSADHSCTYEANGQTFTLRMSGTSVCFVFGCVGRNYSFIMSNINGVPITLVTSGSGATRTIDRLAIGEPERPAGTQDVPGNAAGVVFTGEVDILRGTPGTFNGVPGTFRCQTPAEGCGQRTSNGRLTALTGTWIFVPSSPPPAEAPPAAPAPVEMVTVQDADYLVGGIWVRVPENAASVADYEFGAFMDGSDPFTQANLEGLTGTATYAGDARAVYSHEASNRNYIVDGDVRLTADFGDGSSLGTIGGTLSNFTGEAPGPDWYEGGVVTLGTAQIGSADSGFFTGDTTATDLETGDVFSGKWGGRFYGNGAAATDLPGAVAGTFGGAATTADGRESYVGIYGAFRQPEEQ